MFASLGAASENLGSFGVNNKANKLANPDKKQNYEQECIPVRCVPSVAVSWGTGAVCLGGASVQERGGWVTARHPPVNRIADRCKNITLPQLHCGR